MSTQLEPWSNLEGKVVLITGASSGIGWDFSINLAKAGCKVIAAARRVDRLNSLCHSINLQSSSTTPQAVALELDIAADPPAIEAAIQKAWTTFGHVDVLINNAGIRGGTSSTIKLSEEEWESVLKTNLKGTWLCSKYIGLHMLNLGKGGSIINISSGDGLNRTQNPLSLAYSSSKAGMNAMTRVMALDLGRYNIRVNDIIPLLFESEITKGLFKKKWLKSFFEKTVPLPFYKAPVDPGLTELVRYLMHESSKYVTGNIFIVDGGFTIAGLPIYSSL